MVHLEAERWRLAGWPGGVLAPGGGSVSGAAKHPTGPVCALNACGGTPQGQPAGTPALRLQATDILHNWSLGSALGRDDQFVAVMTFDVDAVGDDAALDRPVDHAVVPDDAVAHFAVDRAARADDRVFRGAT